MQGNIPSQRTSTVLGPVMGTACGSAPQREPAAERAAKNLQTLNSRLDSLRVRVANLAERVCGSEPPLDSEVEPAPPPNGMLAAINGAIITGHHLLDAIDRQLVRLEREGL